MQLVRNSGLFLENSPVQIASDKIADDYADVKNDNTTYVLKQKICRHAQVVENIGYAVRKTAGNE